MAELGIAASIIAVIQLTSEVVSLLFKYGDGVKSARDDIARLSTQLTYLAEVSKSAQRLLEEQASKNLKASHKLHHAFQGVLQHLQLLERELSRSRTRIAYRTFMWPFKAEKIEKAAGDLQRCTDAISAALQIDQTYLLLEVDNNTSRLCQRFVLEKLPVAEGAAFDSHAEEHSPVCHPQTRVDVLRDINQWAKDRCVVPNFWLRGMAGTGKSTISRTVSRSFAAAGLLAASFFFKRGEGDRGRALKLFTTIATQLVESQPALATHVKNVIEKDPRITHKSIREQFNKLILDPLSKVQVVENPTTLIIVVDALDECENEDDIRLLIQIFCNTRALQNVGLRFFITSRPELPIRQDDFDASVSQDRKLSKCWPAQSEIETLVEMAAPLFIFAATACRFLADRRTGNPKGKLSMILDYGTKIHRHKLDATYLPILERQVVGLSIQDKYTVIQQIQTIVGSIVLLANPLTTHALAALLDISKDTIDDRLDMFHSVLDIPLAASSPVRLIHLSFRDFLLNSENHANNSNNQFQVDQQKAHQLLAKYCFRVMSDRLSRDICRLEWPGTFRSDINTRVLQERLPAELQYACRFWTHHLQEAGQHIYDYGSVHDFILNHFLHWAEALSIVGRISECLSGIKVLLSLLVPRSSAVLSHLLTDAYRFLLANASAISSTPLQVYFSALIFAPETSIIRNTFSQARPNWISLLPAVESRWKQYEQTLEGHNDAVTSVMFSHDSKYLISGSRDRTIRIWLTVSGELHHKLQGHRRTINSVAFSHNSELVVSASEDKTARIWLAAEGKLLRILQHSDTVFSAVFSHDSKIIASASGDKLVRVWLTDTGELQDVLEGHHDAVNSVAFSHDSMLIVSASDDKTIRIWSTSTGKQLRILEGHSSLVTSAVFSHNSKLIASGSYDCTVRIWSAETGRLEWTLKGHEGYVTSVTFSYDSMILTSASYDGTVRIWSMNEGELQQVLQGHRSFVSSVSLSRELNRIASASDDRTVRIWSMDIVELQQTSESQNGVDSFMKNAYDLGFISHDENLRINETEITNHFQEIKIFYEMSRLPLDSRDRGTLARLGTMVREYCHVSEAGPNPFENNKSHCLGLGISRDRRWITWDAKNLLWLPEDSRPWCSKVLGSSIAIGCDSGKTYIININKETS